MTTRLTEIVDRHGCVHARLAWDGDAVVELRVAGAIVRGATVEDALFGRAHEIVAASSDPPRVVTTMSAVDWARPTEIPAIAAPGALPPGAGGAIMNALAILAQRAGVTELRYAGPYPTNALYATVTRSFRTQTSEEEFVAAFADRASRLAREPMAAVFAPAPHERLAIVVDLAPTDEDDDADDAEPAREVRGVVELRDGVIERATIDGVVYARGDGIARLVDEGAPPEARVHAELWFADERHARIATLARDGERIDGPHAVPATTSDVVGAVFPPAMTAALAELLADHVPAPLGALATQVVAARTLRWADLGARPAAIVGDELHVHAALWRLSRHGMARLALALALALAPLATGMAVRAATSITR